jgi:hypothetical protein
MQYHRKKPSKTQRRKFSRRIRRAALASGMVILLCIASLLLFRAQKEAAPSNTSESHTPVLVNGECGPQEKKHEGLEHSSVAQLRKLVEYEAVCGTAVADHVSFFVTTPTTVQEATDQAKNVAATLKDFAHYHISPVVFMEPRMANGKTANLTALQNGTYDSVLDAYFATLQSKGITDTQMGLWVPQPEGNTPVWGSSDPAVFTGVVARVITAQKKHFPGSKASLLLESKTSASSKDWVGAYSSFLPYVQNIPRDLVDSVGLQGFPWGETTNNKMSGMIDPKVYLRADLAIAAAQAIGAKQVWFNTGTFRHFGKDGFKPLDLTPEQRQGI